MPNQYTSMPMPGRFWARVNRDGAVPSHQPELGPCWLWTGTRTGSGYGQVRLDGRKRPAHVASWMLTHGTVTDGLFVCHRCDVRLCVRPEHLFLGDHRANMDDMVAKRRGPLGLRNGRSTRPETTARGERHGSATQPERTPRGDDHGNARLTAGTVRMARAWYARGGITILELARLAGVSKAAMAKAIDRTSWQHIG